MPENSAQSQGKQRVSKPCASSYPPPIWVFPREELSHMAGELVFPFLLYSLATKKRGQNRERWDPTAPARQDGANCFLRAGWSDGICSFIFSRGGAASLPPVLLSHNFWISVSEAFSLMSVQNAYSSQLHSILFICTSLKELLQLHSFIPGEKASKTFLWK